MKIPPWNRGDRRRKSSGVQIVDGADLTGQEAPTERRVGHEADAESTATIQAALDAVNLRGWSAGPDCRASKAATAWKGRGPYPGSVRPSLFTYGRGHRFALTPDRLWDRLGEIDQFEAWWPWLSDLHVEGTGLTTGTVLHGVVNPPLPYRMRLRIELARCVRPHAIEADVSGDLRGPASLQLHPDQGGTLVEVAWTIEVLHPAMRLVGRIGRPVLQWGQDRVVEMTVAGFRRRIEQE